MNKQTIITALLALAPQVAENPTKCSNWFSACDFIVERIGD